MSQYMIEDNARSKAPRTSETDPLYINDLMLADSAGRIRCGITLRPGLKSLSAHGAAWERDLEADVAVVAKWAPDVIVLAMAGHPAHERGLRFALEGAMPDTLIVSAISNGWPVPEARETYAEAIAKARAGLSAVASEAPKVLIISRHGLERGGTLLAEWMIRGGMAVDHAIEQANAVRPDCISTQSQRDYLKALAEVSA